MHASILRHNVYRRSLCARAADGRPLEPSAQRTGENDSSHGDDRATYIALDTSSIEGMRDRPPRREVQGDGAAIVLSERESRVQGEGRQVSAARGQGGRRDAERHNCSGASRANGRQTLERRIRRKVYVRCEEGPTEKGRATATSPAAYSTHETLLVKIRHVLHHRSTCADSGDHAPRERRAASALLQRPSQGAGAQPPVASPARHPRAEYAWKDTASQHADLSASPSTLVPHDRTRQR